MKMSRMHFTEADIHKLCFIAVWHVVGPVTQSCGQRMNPKIPDK